MTSIPLHRVKENSKVDIWDLGPKRPEAPLAPKAPDSSLTGAEARLAQIEHEDALDVYDREVRAYASLKREHARWHASNGGPVKVELWGVDARFAVNAEPHRYKLDLPRGTKPGPAQIAADDAARKEREEFAGIQQQDPNFGRQGATP